CPCLARRCWRAPFVEFRRSSTQSPQLILDWRQCVTAFATLASAAERVGAIGYGKPRTTWRNAADATYDASPVGSALHSTTERTQTKCESFRKKSSSQARSSSSVSDPSAKVRFR